MRRNDSLAVPFSETFVYPQSCFRSSCVNFSVGAVPRDVFVLNFNGRITLALDLRVSHCHSRVDGQRSPKATVKLTKEKRLHELLRY